jgi:hypothetical protein
MILDSSPLVDFVEVTVQYSNAVLLAILPHLSDYAGRLGLPVELPLTTNQIVQFGCRGLIEDHGGAVKLTSGHVLDFRHGHLAAFEDPDSFQMNQDWDRVLEFRGPVRMTRAEAVALARKTIDHAGKTALMAAAVNPRS